MTEAARTRFTFKRASGDEVAFWISIRQEDGGTKFFVFKNAHFTPGENFYYVFLKPLTSSEVRVHTIDNGSHVGSPDLAGKGIGPAVFDHVVASNGMRIVSSSNLCALSPDEARSGEAETFWRRLHGRRRAWYRKNDDRWIYGGHEDLCGVCIELTDGEAERCGQDKNVEKESRDVDT